MGTKTCPTNHFWCDAGNINAGGGGASGCVNKLCLKTKPHKTCKCTKIQRKGKTAKKCAKKKYKKKCSLLCGTCTTG